MELPPISTVQNDDITESDLHDYVLKMLDHERHTLALAPEIRSYSALMENGIATIVQTAFGVETLRHVNNNPKVGINANVIDYSIRLTFPTCNVESPQQVNRDGRNIHKNPDDYRVSEGFYTSDISLTARIELVANLEGGGTSTHSINISRLKVSAIPVMVKCSKCSTYALPPENLQNINEDPTDPGGFFIIKGKEYVIQNSENMTFNKPLVFKSTKKTEKVRASVMSQAGGSVYDSSSECTLIYMADNSIVLNLRATALYAKKIPFTLIFKLCGITREKDIARMIIYDLETQDPVLEKMQELVIQSIMASRQDKLPSSAVESSLKMFTLTNNLVDPEAFRTEEASIRHANAAQLAKIDKYVLPHIGTDEKSRYNKMLYIGSLIRDMLLVHLGIRDEDDRDHVGTKRIYGASVAVSKAFKKLFNKEVYAPMLKIIRSTLDEKAFDSINTTDLSTMLRNAVSNDNLKKEFEKYIISAAEDGTRSKGKIRMNSQPLERKNKLNILVTLRTVVSNLSNVAKTTRRSDLARYWHASAAGIYCPADSKENGDKVGLVKQMAITAIISEYDSNNRVMLKEKIAVYPGLITLDKLILHDLYRRKLTRIYIDGDWVGCHSEPYNVVNAFRLMRRRGEIDRYISIEWNCVDNVILMYTDFGRLMRPVLIVDNEFIDGKFVQNIRLTRHHILGMKAGKITFEDLIKEGIVEYIYPGEEIYLCASLQKLRETRHTMHTRWTHCDIGVTLFGINILVGPMLDKNQPQRNTIVTVQTKQACGQPFTHINTATRRMQRFHMIRTHNPLSRTITRNIIESNGQNLIMTYAVLMGYNQDDSSIINKSSKEIGILKGTYYKMETFELDKSHIMCVPKASEVRALKSNKSYAKLEEDGCIAVGSIIEKDDIWLGIVVEAAEVHDNKKFIDKSEQWRVDERGKVVSVIKKLEGSPKFVIITVEYERDINVGDKCTNRSGNKNVCGLLVPKVDMPVTRKGVRPDIILSPTSIPSRMTMSQLFEIVINKLCAKRGVFADATVYRSCDIHELMDSLIQEGIGEKEQMVDGTTGELMDALIFTGPQVVFRLPKFVLDERQVTGRFGPINPQTAQALTGKRVGGGLKVGEYDLWVLLAQGSMAYLHECFYLDSDHREMYVCRNCNEQAIYNPTKSKYRCNRCGDRADIAKIDSSKTSMMMMYKMACSNIKLRLIPQGRQFESYL